MTVSAHGVLHAAGAALAVVVSYRLADRAALDRRRATALLSVGFVGALVAAKALAARSGTSDGATLLDAGGSSLLAVPLAIALGFPAAAAAGLPPLRTMDVACAAAALGLAVARIGCAAAACGTGGAVESPGLAAVVGEEHPVALYEATALGATAAALLPVAANGPAGRAVAAFAAAWGAIRLAILPLSADPSERTGLAVGAAAAALAVGLACAVAMVRRGRNGRLDDDAAP